MVRFNWHRRDKYRHEAATFALDAVFATCAHEPSVEALHDHPTRAALEGE